MCSKFNNVYNFFFLQSGGKILFATDDWFAPAEMMIKGERSVCVFYKYVLIFKIKLK